LETPFAVRLYRSAYALLVHKRFLWLTVTCSSQLIQFPKSSARPKKVLVPAAFILDPDNEIILSLCLYGVSFRVGAASCQVCFGCPASMSTLATVIHQTNVYIISRHGRRFLA
jgi:hypothetical protein